MPRSLLKACRPRLRKLTPKTTRQLQPVNEHTHNTMKKETARTRIYGETQHVARKMKTLLHHERPRRRMESVTPRGLDVTCHSQLDETENLAVDKRRDLSSKPAARGVETRPHVYTHGHITQ